MGGDIGAAMYPVFLEASSVCGQLGACKKVNELVGEATCEECVGGIAAISALTSSEATVADVITFLKGDAYCMGEEGCGGYIDAFMPYAIPCSAPPWSLRLSSFAVRTLPPVSAAKQ